MNTRLSFSLATALAMLLAGCGGSNMGQSNSASNGNSTPGTASTSFTFIVPGKTSAGSHQTIRPNFVSENTQSLTITINGGTPFLFNLSPTAPGCSQPFGAGTAVSCTLALQAPTGANETWIFNLFSAPNAGGQLLATASDVVSVSGPGRLGSFTLNGIVSSYSLAWSGTPNFTAGTNGTATVNLIAKDPSGAVILAPGSYEDSKGNTITFTLNDTVTLIGAPFNNTTWSYAFDNPSVTAPTGTTSPSNAFTLTYGGLSIPPTTITMMDSSGIQDGGANVSFSAVLGTPSGTVTCSSPAAGCSNPTTTTAGVMNFAADPFGFSDTGTIAVSELGWTNSPYNQTFIESDTCGAGSITPGGSPNNWNVANPGGITCTVTLQDSTTLGTSGQPALQITIFGNGG